MHNPAHPGKILKEYIDGFSVTEIAQKLGITRAMLSRILNGKTGISPEMSIRLSELLTNTTPQFWLNLQSQYDLWQLQQNNTRDFQITPLFA